MLTTLSFLHDCQVFGVWKGKTKTPSAFRFRIQRTRNSLLPWYHLSSPPSRDSDLFRYRLYLSSVTGTPVASYRRSLLFRALLTEWIRKDACFASHHPATLSSFFPTYWFLLNAFRVTTYSVVVLNFSTSPWKSQAFFCTAVNFFAAIIHYIKAGNAPAKKFFNFFQFSTLLC